MSHAFENETHAYWSHPNENTMAVGIAALESLARGMWQLAANLESKVTEVYHSPDRSKNVRVARSAVEYVPTEAVKAICEHLCVPTPELSSAGGETI